ncbi:MAG: hypothetical protein ACOY0T_36060 [Myxococcota bacterium]
MRIVEQARLGFREGKSDKVYEVDLVEVAPDQYVVNFRYGRRGTSLRDGTKTPLPISLEKARTVFSALVGEKVKGGYTALAAEETVARERKEFSPEEAAAYAARAAEKLLANLKLGHRSPQPLHLVVRKVGERGLSQAEPFLLELLAAGNAGGKVKPEVLRHFVIAALARCGSSRALDALRAITDSSKEPQHLRDVARLALTMVGGAEERSRARRLVAEVLQPKPGSDVGELVRAAEELLAKKPKLGRAAIFLLYVSGPASSSATEPETERAARRIVLSAARVARLRGAELGLLRSLNWAAEIRRDAELFALLTRRFETERNVARDTKSYFRRRAARSLRRLGSIGSPDYVKLASALALSYSDEDAERIRVSDFGRWDAFARYHALNSVLYGRSPRYERAGHRRATWKCRDGYAPGERAPNVREESYPALWDQAPDELWQLGVSQAANIVVTFAARALRDQTAYLAQVPDTLLASALSGAQRPMRLLAFEVARMRSPNLVLARAALASEIDEADTWVLNWIEGNRAVLSTEVELLVLLVTAKSARVRAAMDGLTSGMQIDGSFAQQLVAVAIAILMQLPSEPAANERAANAAAFLLQRAGDALDNLGIEVVRDLLGHPLAAVAELGGQLVLRRARKSTLEPALLDVLLKSPHTTVRSLGARIVAETPAHIIKDEPELLVHFALSDTVELRAETRKLLAEVARLYPSVGTNIASQLIDALRNPQPEGAPAHVVSLLRHELRAYLPKRDAAEVLALIGALSPHAREAGGLLLAQIGPDELELEAIVRLANHEILLIRQGAWALARAAQDRFRLAPVALAHLCDARWDDSREFAFSFVRSFPPEDLVPDGVIAICDSIVPAVERFGQALLSEYWREDHAERYLLRLSEHPSGNMQLLVSGLLDRYAQGNLKLIEQLLPCLTTILSQVNRGGVAKQRVLTFLRAEAVRSTEAATLLAPLLERQSLTRAVSHKAPLIATMVDLHERYPEVAVPIVSPPVPLQSRGSRGI